MEIQTTRFGQVSFEASEIISFPDGIVGFQDLKKFVLLDDPSDDIFAWLQSCDEASIAFPVLEPELFTENYKINLSKSDLDGLRTTGLESTRLYSIVTVPEDATKMTANMKAPVVINVKERIARQCVLQDNNYAIREPIFAKLQQRIVMNPTQTIKTQNTGLTVLIPASEKAGPEQSL